MAKIDALKEKLSQAQAGLAEKMDKIAFVRKWREQRAETAKKAGQSHSLGSIYRGGGLVTRLQVLLVYLFVFCALFFTVLAARKMMSRFAVKEDKLEEEYSAGLGELASKVVEKATMVSLGKFTVSAYSEGKARSLMVVDVWIRVSDPETADFATKNETKLYDRVVEALNEARQEKVSLLTEEGSETAKAKIQAYINKLLPHGKVEEIFFQNLVVQ